MERLLEQRRDAVADDPGERNFRCESCRGCYDCRFCVACDGCRECTYCEDSVDCVSCTQCKRCLGCEGSSYCADARDCASGKYLTLCVECVGCTHCLGCVGLEGAEFHVLNQPMGRREYFDLAKRVHEELTARAQIGWRPDVIGLEVSGVPDTESWYSDPAADGSVPEELPPGQPVEEVDDPWLPAPSASAPRTSRASRPARSPAEPAAREGTGGRRDATGSASWGRSDRSATGSESRPGLRRGRRPPRR